MKYVLLLIILISLPSCLSTYSGEYDYDNDPNDYCYDYCLENVYDLSEYKKLKVKNENLLDENAELEDQIIELQDLLDEYNIYY